MTNPQIAVTVALALGSVGAQWYIAHRLLEKIEAGFTALSLLIEAEGATTRGSTFESIQNARTEAGQHCNRILEALEHAHESRARNHRAFEAATLALHSHAVQIKAHSKEVHDRAVSRDIAPRHAVTRS